MPNTMLFRHILRATIEFQTPFTIGAGKEDTLSDSLFVTDANGLPAIPGSSLAGVLRAQLNNLQDQNRIFGFHEGSASRLRVTWACIHDSQNKPVEGLATPERLSDPVLANALNPTIRDHVRINHKGASANDQHGKFDEKVVSAGHRFTFEMEFLSSGDEVAHSDWEKIKTTLQSPLLRIGGKTRRGYGKFTLITLLERVFNLGKDTDFKAYQSHSVSLQVPATNFLTINTPKTNPVNAIRIQIKLKPEGYWMIGGGEDMATDTAEADMAPIRDNKIVWKDNTGSVQRDILVIPATAIKGALSHRIAFHYNALTGKFADTPQNPATDGSANEAIRQLFGYVDEKGKACKGIVIIDDVYVFATEPRSQFVQHVGIDRFTGGSLDQVLFNERPLWQGSEMEFSITIAEKNPLPELIRMAFTRTLEDLTQRRLQLGAGSGRGLGYFTGKIQWPETPDWKPTETSTKA